MNFSELSDFEINKAVAEIKFRECIELEIYENSYDKRSADIVSQGVNIASFDFNSPSDAWPIIVENEISIEKNSRNTEYWRAITWEQISGSEFRPIEQCEDKNPLRAAMIVYLMMQESAND